MSELKHPDARAHLIVSIIKSLVRIVACSVAIALNSVIVLATGLAIAEAIGIYEELV